MATRVSFKAVLREREKSCPSSDDRAHLQRWADDDRAEEVWHKIERAAHNNKLWLPAKHFVTEILAARRVAMAIGHRFLARSASRAHVAALSSDCKSAISPNRRSRMVADWSAVRRGGVLEAGPDPRERFPSINCVVSAVSRFGRTVLG